MANEKRGDTKKEEKATQHMHVVRFADTFYKGASLKFTHKDKQTWWEESGGWEESTDTH